MTINSKHIEILRLLNEDWEIGTGWDSRAWMQKGGLGKGGETKDVNYHTFFFLWKNGLIAHNDESDFARPQHYHITEKGKAQLAADRKE